MSLLGLLLGSRRRLSAGVSMAVLAFYMLVVGLSPSVVRACIMQAFVLAAPLFKRDSDGLTSLGAALLVILLANPFAAGSISLQLSFAATLGLVWLSPKLYRNLSRFYTGTSRAVRWAVNFLGANVSASVSALVFTIPLTAIYFNILTLTAPISNLLAVPAAGWNFMAGFVTVLVGFVWLPAARVLGWVCFGLVRYVLWVAGVLASGHAVYFSNGFLKYWLLYVYAMFGGCLLTRDRRRKYAVAGVLAAATLALAVGLNTGLHQYGDLSVMALDVGQGESVALYTREKAVLVDCGSSNSYISAGARAADQLESMGIHRLSAVAVTHYHADHTNGLEELLARMPVERLLLPEIQDEYGVRDRLLALARELDIPVTMVTDTYQFPMDQAMLTIYPPVGAGDLNEQGLTFLCSAGDFDALITGDMAGNTEKKLVERFDLPDIEVLVVGHHGSRYSSTDAFLQQVRPETAIISVGDNSYGHPTQEAMDRLSRNGATVYRTDRQGNGSPENVYIFYGEETYLRDRYLEELKALLVPEGFEEFNYHRLSGKGLTVQDLTEVVEAMPMMAQHTLTVVTDMDLFRLDEGQRGLLINLLGDFPEYGTLVFVYDVLPYKRDGKMKKLCAAIGDHAQEVEFCQQERDQLLRWMKRRFAAEGHDIDTATADHLLFTCGTLMTDLVPEIGKIAAYAKGERITVADINAVADPILDAQVFDMTNSITAGKYDDAARVLGELLRMQTEPIVILAAVGKELRRLYTARMALDGGKDRLWLKQLWNMSSDYPAKLLMQAARKVDHDWCRTAVLRCQQLDRRMKSMSMPDKQKEDELKLFLMELAGRR